ncbi:hypothetical protein HNQ00_002335 [Flavobacterium sp. 14A]|nr:hypothetical protein [Flavobacterium sp. 14A]
MGFFYGVRLNTYLSIQAIYRFFLVKTIILVSNIKPISIAKFT